MSASAQTLTRTPAIMPFCRSERFDNDPTHTNAGAGEHGLSIVPRGDSADSPELSGAVALNALKREILEWPDRTVSAQEALFVLTSLSLLPDEARQKASELLKKFGSLGGVFSAPRELIKDTVRDLGEFWVILKSIQSIIVAILREPIEDRPIVRDQSSLHDYLRVSLSHEKRETVRLLFLNTKNALILDELHSRGTLNHTPVYPREIVKRVIEVGANALIIVHNHPSGDPAPSQEDVDMTRVLSRVLRDIGVVLHDHVIVGLNRCQSMRALELI